MNDWLIKSKDQFQESIFNFLWQQWSTLGIAGVSPSEDNRIIDPEALLLFSLSTCRNEPRLFDEIIDWLFLNGQIINVQRLQQMQKKYQFHCGPQLSAIAELLSKKPTYKLKWAGLAKKYYQSPTEPLFYDTNGNPLPCPPAQDANLEFLNHGLRRGQINLRRYSQSFNSQSPSCLLLRLRALIGINARAEILCLLASTKEIHPSEAARRSGYYQKTIQTTLIEMVHSGIILTKTSRKEKYYLLKQGILETLLAPDGKRPTWINWPDLLNVTETLWLKISELSKLTHDRLLLISELKILMQSIHENCLKTNIDEITIADNVDIDRFTGIFQEKLRLISDTLTQTQQPQNVNRDHQTRSCLSG